MRTSRTAALSAYGLIFASNPATGELERLDRQQLKKAYRKRALQCHPDRAPTVGRTPAALEREFSQVSDAYELLCAYLEGQGTTVRRAPEADLWQGALPLRPLRFGEFLYYSRSIGLRTLEAALAWQQRERPRFGTLAREWGMLTEPQIEAILGRRQRQEGIAQACVRLGFLSRTQAEAVLTMQMRRQKPLGTYLVAIGALPYDQLAEQVAAHAQHNAGQVGWAA